MTTKVYGASDDLIEFDGEFTGEVGCYGTDDREHGVLVIMSDGTMLEVKYGKGGRGIWAILLVKRGSLLDRVEQCSDEMAQRLQDANPHSDVAYFRNGITWAYAATEWQVVN